MSLERITRKLDSNFTTINNQILKDKRISLKAKALHITVMSLPADWDFSIAGIVSILKEGRESIYNAINELIEFGYIERSKIYENGKIKEWHYCFNQCLSESELLTGNLEIGFQEQGNLEQGNPPQLSIKEIKDLTNKEKKEQRSASAQDSPQNVREVFAYWQTKLGKENFTLTADRQAKIKTRLKVFTVDQLKLAIDGTFKDDWLMGRTEKSVKQYNDFETIFKTDSKVEILIELSKQNGAKNDSKTTNTNGQRPSTSETTDEVLRRIGARPVGRNL